MKYLIGIDLGGTNLRGAVMDQSGKILFRKKEESKLRTIENGAQIIAQIADFSHRLMAKAKVPISKLSQLGLGIPGTITHDSGLVVVAPHIPGLSNFPIKAELAKLFSCKLVVDNDANCITLGEFHKGAGRGAKNLCLLSLGTGVGGGIVIDGELYRGASGFAGELGHLVIDKDGPLCRCGNRGCLETYCSSFGFQHILQKCAPTKLLPKKDTEPYTDLAFFFSDAEKGDKLALEAFKLMGTYLGVGLSCLVNIFNPELIVVTGGIAQAWEYFAENAISEMHARAFSAPRKDVRVVRGKLGDDAGIIGTMFL